MTTAHTNHAWQLSPDQIDRTLAFLAPFLERHHPASTITAATFARACLLLTAGAYDQARAEAEELSSWISEQPDPSKLDLDPLVLSAYAFELSREISLPEQFSQLTAALGHALADLPITEAERPRARWTARLLKDAGIPINVKLSTVSAFPHTAGSEHLLTMSDEEVGEVIDLLAAERGDLTDLAWTLGLLGLAMLRNYRIEIAANILRLLIEAGHAHELVQEAIAFVALQRCSDGGYGFADPFLDGNDQAPDLEFRLPITVNAMWLLRTAVARSSLGQSAVLEQAE